MSKMAELYQEGLDCFGEITVNYIMKHQGVEGLIEALQEKWYEETMESEIQTRSKITVGGLGTYKRVQKEEKGKELYSYEDRKIPKVLPKV